MPKSITSELGGLEKKLIKIPPREEEKLEEGEPHIKGKEERIEKGPLGKIFSKIGLISSKTRLEEAEIKAKSKESIGKERVKEAKEYLKKFGYNPYIYSDKEMDGEMKKKIRGLQWRVDGRLRTVKIYGEENKKILVSNKDHPKPYDRLDVVLSKELDEIKGVLGKLMGKEVKMGISRKRKIENRLGGPASSRAKILTTFMVLGGYLSVYSAIKAIYPETEADKLLLEMASGAIGAYPLYKEVKRRIERKLYGEAV